MVEVLVDLLGVTVALEKTAQDASAAHGEDLGGHASVLVTLAVAQALVAAIALLLFVDLDAVAGVDGDLGALDVAVLVELTDVLARVGKSDLAGLVGVNPDALAAALEHGGGQAALESEHCHLYVIR